MSDATAIAVHRRPRRPQRVLDLNESGP
jgi:hypothetical protein